jgi:ATP-dependent exoDNAse (exonuclease V) beta subunit
MTDMRGARAAPPSSREIPDAGARQIIRESLDDTLVVEAAAGTGKTTELVARLVNLLASGRAAVDQVVAVTFTEKAAGELKLRIREELEKARSVPASGSGTAPRASADGTELDEAVAERRRAALDAALSHLEESHIGTIHGFCAELLRERPVEARVDPEFAVLTEAQADRLFDEAFRVWLHDQLAGPGEGVRRTLRRHAPPWQDEDGEGPIGRLRYAGRELREWRDFTAAWRRDPSFDRDGEIRRLLAELCAFGDMTARPSWSGDPIYTRTKALRTFAAEVSADLTTATADSFDAWEAQLVELAADRDLKEIATHHGARPQFGGGATRAQVMQSYAALMAALESFQRRADADLAALVRLDLGTCIERYDELKRRAGALDFLDLLLRTRDLVRDHGDVRRSWQRRFRHLFVDEFQDTDPLQAEILLLLAATESDDGEAPAERGSSRSSAARTRPDWRRVAVRRGALFVVGDPKQSIYRFRRADVGTYQEVCRLLAQQGALRLELTTSFRAVPNIQRFINAAFAPAMTGDRDSLQADYVPLSSWRPPLPLAARADAPRGSGLVTDADSGHAPTSDDIQPSVIALPVPRPYGKRRLSGPAVEASLPDALGAFVHWLVRESGWTVIERVPAEDAGSGSVTTTPAARMDDGGRVPVQPRHVCVLFRRFLSRGEDVTRPYVEALEARGVPHLLVGGKTFHGREEVDTLRAALAAIEWPEDQLSVYATLRGALFAIGEEALLEYWAAHPRRRFHPFDIPDDLPPGVQPVREALHVLRTLHARRNHRPVPDTIADLLEVTRAHVTFVLRPAGEQALANVLHVAELARQYEADGGISFRGFVEELREAAERSEAAEAPVLEEGSDGVRLMTVHKAKGLEFPVVVLADLTCRINRTTAARALDPEAGLAAVRLVGCAPLELLERQPIEVSRDRAEGVRLAYVAATRARDLLVVSAVGDGPYPENGWLAPLDRALFPAEGQRRIARAVAGCPPFRKDTVLERPDGDPYTVNTVHPGLHPFGASVDAHHAVWWDPSALTLDVEGHGGVRRSDLIAKDSADLLDQDGLAAYRDWRDRRASAIASGSAPTLRVRTMTDWASIEEAWPIEDLMPAVDLVRIPWDGEARAHGARLGALVHAALAIVPLDAGPDVIRSVSAVEARIIGADPDEIETAVALVGRILAHPLLAEARAAETRGACRREVPVTLTIAEDALLEGTIDLAFEREGQWTIVDFKTDTDIASALDHYRMQVALYAAALARASQPVRRSIILSA